MCVIFHKPAGVAVSELSLRNAHRVNNDGFGFMYFNPEDKRIHTFKGLVKDVNTIIEYAKDLTEFEVCYHFRIKTHGVVADSTCHPFQVTNKETHGSDIFFMHNGVISGMQSSAVESDTQMFNKNILFPLLEKNPGFLKTEACKILIEKMLGTGNKLCFMDTDGEVIKFNAQLGDTYEGMWVSNKNFVPYTAPPSTRTNRWSDEDYSYAGYKAPEYKSKPTIFNNTEVEVGDKMYIWHKDSNSFYAEGTIKSCNQYSATIEFVDRLDCKINALFLTHTSESNFSYPGYECLPAGIASDEFQTIDQVENKGKRQEHLKELSCEVPKSNIVLLSDPKKQMVRWQNHSVDANGGYGGLGLENTLQPYKDNVTLLDVHNMQPQERFQFFNQKVETSFLMFQDMLDKMVEEDCDLGIVGDIAEEEAIT